MALAYGTGTILPLFLLIQYVMSTIYQKQLYSWVSNLVILLCFLLLIISALLSYLFPVFSLKEPSGAFGIGTASYVWRDDTREEEFSPVALDKRQVVVQVWYPTDKQARKGADSSPYFPNRVQATRQLQEDFRLPGWLFQHFDLVKTHAYDQSAMSSSQAKYPVIFFSHGLPAACFAYSYFTEHLVSHGYIVVGLQHPYTALSTPLSPDRVVTFDKRIMSLKGGFIEINPALSQIVRTQACDAVFVLNEMLRMQKENASSDFWGRFDLERVGMAGHSLGGATMLEALHMDARFQAGVFLDGHPYGSENMDGGLQQPILYMNDHRGTNSHYSDSAVEAKKRLILQNGGWDITISGTHHFMFSDAALYSPLISFMFPYTKGSAISPDRAHDIINQGSLAFFEHRLKNQPAELLEEAFSAFPEVSINRKYGK
ncbi:MAG: alpha/beta hydrolase family protein [Bacillota bacterium]